MPEELSTPTEPRPTASGPGRVLVAVYAVFALAATSRAAVQIATTSPKRRWPTCSPPSRGSSTWWRPSRWRAGSGARRLALAAITIELVGVLVIGTASLLAPEHFPRATVWSGYGSGYGFVPLVLPLVGLWWLRRTSRG